MNQRRKLILVSKVLQCLANGVEFGEKESYMQFANKFIRNYRESMRRMLIYLAVCCVIQPHDTCCLGCCCLGCWFLLADLIWCIHRLAHKAVFQRVARWRSGIASCCIDSTFTHEGRFANISVYVGVATVPRDTHINRSKCGGVMHRKRVTPRC
jgi:hypothetical protein